MGKCEDRKRKRELGNAYLSGERICGVKYRHNSHVSFRDTDGKSHEGWIVSVDPIAPEPIYAIEHIDGSGDQKVKESLIELIYDPHEKE
jgi:hypothetical protein